MAPYSIAHLKISLTLQKTGYTFSDDRRLNIYLTNTLEPSGEIPNWVPNYLSLEANEANIVKKMPRIKKCQGSKTQL